MKHLFRYLKGTKHLTLTYNCNLNLNNMSFMTYADTSFADDLLYRYSTGAHVVFLAGCPVY